MVNCYLGNPHKTEYEDIDEDFNVFDAGILDDQDSSSDYEDNDDDYEDEDDIYDQDDIYDEDDIYDDDGTENYLGLAFLEDSDINNDVPGPPEAETRSARSIFRFLSQSEWFTYCYRIITTFLCDMLSKIIPFSLPFRIFH